MPMSHSTSTLQMVGLPNSASTFAWNALMRSSPSHQTLSLYHQMLRSPAPPNKFTFTSLVKSGSQNSTTHFVKHIHSHIIKFGFSSDTFLQTALINVYAKAGLPTLARQVFDKIPHPDIVSFTALISAYAKCRLPEEARSVFDAMPVRNSVSWAALISSYSQCGLHKEALKLFEEMRLSGVEPTKAALVSILSSAAHLGALEEGIWVHNYINYNHIPLTASLGTALLNMHAKCGCIEDAVHVFHEMHHRDAPAYTAMILALANHGQGENALLLFDEMIRLGLRPDGVTFIGVLTACSHAGLVEAGRYHFGLMRRVYEIEPGLEHYGCMVDVLGRSGFVEEAWDMAREMPMEADGFVLKSLLSACSSHAANRRVEIAEWAAKKLMRLDAGNASAYVLLANVYAMARRWDDSERMRKMMRYRGVPKVAGSSLVEG